MKILYCIIFFILGLHMGSFFTVIGFRSPKGEDYVRGRSYCDNCHHMLSLLDMIPILSFLFLRGKCRYCKCKISPVSTYMELFTGLLFLLAFYIFGFSYDFGIALGIISLLIIISVSDITYYIIPDEILIFFSGYFLILLALKEGVMGALFHVLSGLFLFGVMYMIMLIGDHVFKKETLGGGDIKLMFVFGLLLNPLLGVVSIFLGSFLALPVSLILLLLKKEKLVPFGPFLMISLAFLFFTQIDTQMILGLLGLS